MKDYDMIHTLEYYSAIKMNTDTHKNMNESLNHSAKLKKPNIKEYILCDFTYILL